MVLLHLLSMALGKNGFGYSQVYVVNYHLFQIWQTPSFLDACLGVCINPLVFFSLSSLSSSLPSVIC